MHVDVSGKHALDAQRPALQYPPQHSAAVAQLPPLAVHEEAQVPALQYPPQHCVPLVQLVPLVRHALDAQRLALQYPPQH